MIIAVSKMSSELMGVGKILDHWDNGYPVLKVNKNDVGMAFVPDQIDIYQDVDVPEEVELYKYCYSTDEGFYLNPDRIENEYGVEPDILERIKADYREQLTQEVASNGYNA